MESGLPPLTKLVGGKWLERLHKTRSHAQDEHSQIIELIGQELAQILGYYIQFSWRLGIGGQTW